MKAPLLLTALLLALPASALDDPAVLELLKNRPSINGKAPPPDLSGQFIDAPARDQKDIGSCHSFAAVGLAEAVFSRMHGHQVRFSEEDVFLQRMLVKGAAFPKPCSSRYYCRIAEGSYVHMDVEHILSNGVLLGSNYGQFAERYGKFRDRYETKGDRMLDGYRNGVMKSEAYSLNTPLEKLFAEPTSAWWGYLADPQIRDGVLNELSIDEAWAQDREKTRKMLAGARWRGKSFEAVDPVALGGRCGEVGRERLAAVIGELDAGRPVAVSMRLDYLKAWGNIGQHSYHAFLITGYTKKGGRTALKVRNSWGGLNPDVLDSEACRIFVVDTLLAPGEKETF